MADKIIDTVNKYYTDKIKTHGATPAGVDWNSQESQELRFGQLLKVINEPGEFSILDYGCGFGSLYGYMQSKYSNYEFTGFDISSEMLEAAKQKFNQKNSHWINKLDSTISYDYVVASGIFNVRQQFDDAAWQKYIVETLDSINKVTTKGFAVNMLTSYSDKEYMKDYLYYANPNYFFDYCKTHYSKYVAVLHDYPLYEFTLIVRK